MNEPTPTRKCTICKEQLPMGSFSGRNSYYCRPCASKYRRDRYHADPKVRANQKRRVMEWQRRNKERFESYKRRYYLKTRDRLKHPETRPPMTHHHPDHHHADNKLLERMAKLVHELNDLLYKATNEHGLDLRVTIIASDDDCDYSGTPVEQIRIRQTVEIA